jgi:cysteinyl-tRNA synthetase
MLSGRLVARKCFRSSALIGEAVQVQLYIYNIMLVPEGEGMIRRCFTANNKTTSTSSAECTSDLRLWDSLSESNKRIPLTTQGTESSPPKALAWYTCGPTTYAAMHLGHARTYVWMDMMRRVLQAQATAKGTRPPLFVMNITDIDDKILQAAAANGIDSCPLSLSRQAEAAFWKDMDRLNCQRPHIVTRVTEHVESDIVPYIDRLVQTGMAYTTHDGVYFNVAAFEASGATYGKLAGNAVQQQSPQQSMYTKGTKRDARDFCLWKLQKPGEAVAWPSPYGDGRPGWHIECSAMIEAVARQFADTHEFLVHAGGHDLKFPHHTNEIAQAEAFHHHHHHPADTGSCPSCTSTREWIPHWVHTGHLMVKDAKMSKSLGNYLTVQELWFDQQQYDDINTNHTNNNASQSDAGSHVSSLSSPSDDFRMWCLLGGSYRHKEEYSRSRIRNARQQREKILRFLMDGERWMKQCMAQDDQSATESSKRWSPDDHAFFNNIGTCSSLAYQALLDDMNGTRFVSNLIQIAEAASAFIRHKPARAGANVEHIKLALSSCRDLLALVGFTPLTVRAGSSSWMVVAEDNDNDADSSGYVVGGEKALVEELVRFRGVVRMAILDQLKQQKNPDASNNTSAKSILKACDELRDKLPAMGVELMDSTQPEAGDWRFCVPKERKS